MDQAVRALNSLLMIGLGLGLGTWLSRRWKLPWGLFGIGAATFVASQAAHIPFNSLVLNRVLTALGWADASTTGALIGVAVLAGLSAGVFEEGARYLMYRYWARSARAWDQALMIAAGHGGIEAALLGLLAGYGLLQALALRDVDLAAVIPAQQIEAARVQLEAYWAVPWYGALLGATERAFALCLHLSLGVLVLQCFARRSWAWLLAAIGWHALVDAAAVVGGTRLGVYWTEALVGAMALISLGIVFSLRRPREAERASEETAPLPQPLSLMREDRPTPDQLEDSRFSGGASV